MLNAVDIEVMHILPEGWGICLTCEAFMAQAGIGEAPHLRGLDEYPADWQDDFRQFSDFIFELSARYGEKVRISIFDARSLQGLWKAVRHGVHRYPAFIIARRDKVVGLDEARIIAIIEKYVQRLQV